MGMYLLQIPYEWAEYANELLLKIDAGLASDILTLAQMKKILSIKEFIYCNYPFGRFLVFWMIFFWTGS
jgi:hypothetical protein